jgi:hypothetical protein
VVINKESSQPLAALITNDSSACQSCTSFIIRRVLQADKSRGPSLSYTMGKQKVKSNQQATQKLMEKTAVGKATSAIDCLSNGFVQGPDLLYALGVVAGTEWEVPLAAL